METQSFVLGVLVTFLVFLTGLIVFGLVKIGRLIKEQIENKKKITIMQAEIISRDQAIRRILEETSRDITIVERTIMARIDREIEQAHRHIEDEVEEIHRHEEMIHREIDTVDKKHENVEKNITQEIQKAISYTDSKIARMVLSGSLSTSKRVKI